MIVNGYSEQIDTRRMIADVDVNMAIPDILRQDLGSLGGLDPERAFVRTRQAGNADLQGPLRGVGVYFHGMVAEHVDESLTVSGKGLLLRHSFRDRHDDFTFDTVAGGVITVPNSVLCRRYDWQQSQIKQ